MSDADWRQWERRWEGDPADQGALRRAIAGRRRAGVAVPARLLEALREPARAFVSEAALTVWALLGDGSVRRLGRMPAPAPLAIPEHRVFWVTPDEVSDARLEDLAPRLIEQRVPGLSLGGHGGGASSTHTPQVTDGGVEALAAVESLTWLRLAGAWPLGDAGLERLARLEGLLHLDLWRCENVTDRGLFALSALPALSWLRLSSCEGISDAGLAGLARLTHLTRLHLRGCQRITGRGLTALASLQALTALNLAWCEGIRDRDLEHLASLRALRWLDLSRCPHVTAGGRERLRALLPGCEVAG